CRVLPQSTLGLAKGRRYKQTAAPAGPLRPDPPTYWPHPAPDRPGQARATDERRSAERKRGALAARIVTEPPGCAGWPSRCRLVHPPAGRVATRRTPAVPPNLRRCPAHTALGPTPRPP